MAPHVNTISDVGRQCLRLKMTEGIGPKTFGDLLESFGTADAVLEADETQLRAIRGLGRVRVQNILNSRWKVDVESEIEQAAEFGVRIVSRLDPEYPEILLQTPDPPICLYVQGTLERTDSVAVAIVGSRNCSHYGHEQAHRFGYLLAQAGFTIVSGMARGIDSHAHVGALDADGRTIAVLGNGLSNTYPPESTDLRSRIVERGAVISELPIQAKSLDRHFPGRNRIIAGLSLGTLVVEAGFKSGALITADFATDYNREVFAIPGRLDSGTSFGSNMLIRDSKAKLITRLEDILVELGEAGATLTQERDPEKPVLDDIEQKIFDTLKSAELIADEIIAETELTPAQVGGALTMLQLKGAIQQLPGNRYARSRASAR